jgi:hypothetical protein
MTNHNETARDALVRQITVMHEAIYALNDTINAITGTINPEEATWLDIARFAQIADAARRFVETVRRE